MENLKKALGLNLNPDLPPMDIEVVREFISYVMEREKNETPDALAKEISVQYLELTKLLTETIICSEWYEENIGYDNSNSMLLSIQYLNSIRSYEVVLRDAKQANDNQLMNFYYGKIKDLKTALSELLCTK